MRRVGHVSASHDFRSVVADGERFARGLPEHLQCEISAMKKISVEVVFYLVAAAVILPAPTMLWAYVTGKTLEQVLYR
jgi:hypothetical protein